MWPRSRASNADRLSRYWNALVKGSSLADAVRLAEPLDPAIQEMVSRVRAQRLRAAPDPAFVARLERDVLRVFAASTLSSVAPNEGRSVPIDDAPPRNRWPVMPSVLELGRRTLAMAATAVLVLVTLGFAFIAFFPLSNGVQDVGPGTPVASPIPEGSPVSTQPPGAGINIVGVDGTGLAGVGDDTNGADPVWSPDGSKVAFTSEDGIYVMNADGSGRTLVVEAQRDLSALASGEPGADGNPGRLPSWSPDGGKIAYATRQGAIYVVDSNGENRTKLADPGERTTTGESFQSETGYDWRPAWSPDGDQIAFVSGYGPAREILLVSGLIDRDPEVTPLVDLPGDITGPAWSPDGKLAFFVTSADSSNGVYLIRPGGGEPQRLTDVVPISDSSPTWAPDGSGLLFLAMDGVWSVNADGSGLVKVSTVPRGAMSVALSPDGSKIAFVAEGFPYVVGIDGSGLRRLANLPTEPGNLVWSPDGKSLTFSSQ